VAGLALSIPGPPPAPARRAAGSVLPSDAYLFPFSFFPGRLQVLIERRVARRPLQPRAYRAAGPAPFDQARGPPPRPGHPDVPHLNPGPATTPTEDPRFLCFGRFPYLRGQPNQLSGLSSRRRTPPPPASVVLRRLCCATRADGGANDHGPCQVKCLRCRRHLGRPLSLAVRPPPAVLRRSVLSGRPFVGSTGDLPPFPSGFRAAIVPVTPLCLAIRPRIRSKPGFPDLARHSNPCTLGSPNPLASCSAVCRKRLAARPDSNGSHPAQTGRAWRENL